MCVCVLVQTYDSSTLEGENGGLTRVWSQHGLQPRVWKFWGLKKTLLKFDIALNNLMPVHQPDWRTHTHAHTSFLTLTCANSGRLCLFFHLAKPKEVKFSFCAIPDSFKDLPSDHPVRKRWGWVHGRGLWQTELSRKTPYQKPSGGPEQRSQQAHSGKETVQN